jgi:hypothetical protein
MNEKIDIIQVSVQSAEVALIGYNAVPSLVINGSLMNIARGNMTLTLRTIASDHVGAIGLIEIEQNRPMMQAQASVSQDQFTMVLNCLKYHPPRPVTLIIALQESLVISGKGYLASEGQNRRMISNLSWSIPIM